MNPFMLVIVVFGAMALFCAGVLVGAENELMSKWAVVGAIYGVMVVIVVSAIHGFMPDE